MHRLTFWFPLLFLSFYLSISSPFAFIVVCLLFEFFFFFFFFFFFLVFFFFFFFLLLCVFMFMVDAK